MRKPVLKTETPATVAAEPIAEPTPEPETTPASAPVEFLFAPTRATPRTIPDFPLWNLDPSSYSPPLQPLLSLYIPSGTNTATAVAEAFSKPSFDDTVLAALVLNVTKKLEKVEITPKAKAIPKPVVKAAPKAALKAAPAGPPPLLFIVIGHVDAGKSTLMGRLLYDSGVISPQQLSALQKESQRAGKGSFALAWVMDTLSEERAHGVTTDIATTTFEVQNRRLTIVDAPGHADYVPQMIAGCVLADLAVVVVDVLPNEFEGGFAKGGQTKEHILLAHAMGVKRFIVAVNKMDRVGWSESRFHEVLSQVALFMEELGVEATFVPCAGLLGEGVVKPVAEEWVSGKPLIQTIVDEPLPPRDLTADPAFVVVDAVPAKKDVTLSGKVLTGTLSAGTVLLHPEPVKVVLVANEGKTVAAGFAGDHVSIKVSSDLQADGFKPGDFLSATSTSVASFQAKVTFYELARPVLAGTPLIVFIGGREYPARVASVDAVEGKKRARHVGSNSTAVVTIAADCVVSSPLVVLRAGGITIGSGVVEA